jgi:hypothetical protein
MFSFCSRKAPQSVSGGSGTVARKLIHISGFLAFWIARKPEIWNSGLVSATDRGWSPTEGMPIGQQASGDARRREWRGSRKGDLAQFQGQSRIQKRIQRVCRSPRNQHDRSSQRGFHALQEEAAKMIMLLGRMGRARWYRVMPVLRRPV